MEPSQGLDPFRVDLALVDAATDRLLSSMEGLSDADTSRPSLLPGWTIGHCLTHIARNADGINNLVTWAVTGTHTPMYPSMDVRNSDIEDGAARSAQEHRDDVRISAERLARNFERLAEADDTARSRLVLFGAPPPGTAPDTPAALLAFARLREVTIHHADLGLSDFGFTDFDEPFVTRTLAFIEDRSGAVDVSGPANDLLAWRLGRGTPGTLRDSAGNPPVSPPAW
jgi:maleylpyruvate isomerase